MEETKTQAKKPLSGVRKWWREQLDAPHPQSRTNSVPICPCVYCFHGGDPHPRPHNLPARNTFSGSTAHYHNNKKSFYLLQQTSTTSTSTSTCSYDSLTPLIKERNAERTHQAGAPQDPTALLNSTLTIPNRQIPDQMAGPVERVEQHRPSDQEFAHGLDSDR